MRVISSAFALILASGAFAQVWEKPIAPGLTYRMEIDRSVPRIVHALRFSQGARDVKVVSELGGGVVFNDNDSKGRETISQMVARTGALAGINADFFPFTGDPLGVMVKNGELLSTPSQPRSVFGWGDRDISMGLVHFEGRVSADGLPELVLDGYNEEVGLNRIALNTEVAGYAVAKQPNVHAVIRMEEGSWGPNGTRVGTFQYLVADNARLPIEKGYAVLSAQGNKTQLLSQFIPGQRVRFTLRSSGIDWKKVEHAVGGGPFLLRSGVVHIDAEKQGFNDAFTNKRHPRTAIGRTMSGDIWLVAVDGRQKISDGATLPEMAVIMKRLGCADAVNLDGGGSTTLNIFGLTLNRISDPVERPVANGILIFGPKPTPGTMSYVLKSPGTIYAGDTPVLTVANTNDRMVPNAEILWTATGAAWIDQGGMLYAQAPGKVTVQAVIQGQFVVKELEILEAPKPTPAKQKTTTSRGSGKRKRGS